MTVNHINMTGASGLPIMIEHRSWDHDAIYDSVIITMAVAENTKPVRIELECHGSMVQPLLSMFLANVEVCKLIK